MAKKFTPKVLTANDLLSGDVVYFGTENSWVNSFEEACFLADEVRAMAVLRSAETQSHLVGPYLADAELDQNNFPQPVHFREEFRTTGPSNYNHGKQAQA